MSETKMPGVNPDEPASANQEKMLKEIGKWSAGMTKDEASAIISRHVAENMMDTGVQALKIHSIEKGQKGDGTDIQDKDGNPCIKITFRNKKGQNISDLFFFPKRVGEVCKSEFKLRKLKQALNVKAEDEQDIAVLKTKKMYGLVAEVHLIDEEGNPIKDNQGNIQMHKQLLSEYYNGEMSAPIIAGDPQQNNGVASDKFLQTKVLVKGTAAAKEAPKAKTGGSEAGADEWA